MQLICTHCDTLFDNDLSKLQDMNDYQCKVCNNVFLQPCITYTCNTCNFEKFGINGVWVDMFKFNLQSENLSKIKKNIFLLGDLEKY